MTVLFRWMFVSSLLRTIAITIAIVAIFMIAESFDKARALGNGMTMALLAEYLLLKIPFMISDFMPVIVLIATAVYMTEISHHHELAAMRAAGIAMPTLLKPLLAAAACAALFTFAMSEWVEPITNERLSYIERVHIQKKSPIQHGTQWLRDKQQMFRLKPLRDGYFSMMILKVDKKGTWLGRIDAKKAHYKQGMWHLEHVSVNTPNKALGIQVQTLEKLDIVSSVGPETAAAPSPRDMQWLELYDFTHVLMHAGLDADEYVFQLHKKLTAPLACLIMVILAYSLCGHMGSRVAANSKGLLFAVVLGLIFYIFSTVLVVLGSQLPIIYAAWWPNIMFLGIAGYLLLHREGY